jgi:hypothetical protein
MTDAHIVSTLKEKRIQAASQIEFLQGQLKQIMLRRGCQHSGNTALGASNFAA